MDLGESFTSSRHASWPMGESERLISCCWVVGRRCEPSKVGTRLMVAIEPVISVIRSAGTGWYYLDPPAGPRPAANWRRRPRSCLSAARAATATGSPTGRRLAAADVWDGSACRGGARAATAAGSPTGRRLAATEVWDGFVCRGGARGRHPHSPSPSIAAAAAAGPGSLDCRGAKVGMTAGSRY